MMGRPIRLGPAVCVAVLLAGPAHGQSPAMLTLIGENGTSRTLSWGDLTALPQTDLPVREADSTTAVFRGPSLRALMTLVGAPTGRALRGVSMTLAVLAEATDGYQVAFTLAELDEQFGARSAVLALTQDGRPLPEGQGPLRIVVAGEQRHARWIRQVVRLRLVRVSAPEP